MVENPLRDAAIDLVERGRCRHRAARHLGSSRRQARQAKATLGFGQQKTHPRFEGLPHVTHRNFDQLVAAHRARQLAGHFVKAAAALLAVLSHPYLEPQASGQVASDQADDQHHAEGEQVLEIVDHHGEPWRHKTEIENRHVEDGRQNRWPAAEAHAHQRHRQYKKHGNVGGVDEVGQWGSQEGGDEGSEAGLKITPWPRWRPGEKRSLGRLGPAAFGGSGDQLKVDFRGQELQAIVEGAAKTGKQGRFFASHEDPAEIVATGVFGQAGRRVRTGQGSGFRAQLLGKVEGEEGRFPFLLREPAQLRRFHIDRVPARIELSGQAGGSTHHGFAVRRRANRRQKGFAGFPHRPDRLAAAVDLHFIVDPLGRPPQGQLTQGDQIALAEKMMDGAGRLLWQVDLAFPQAFQELVGRQVDEHDFVGFVEQAIGQGFAHLDPGNAADDVVEAFEVLHVDGGPDVEAGGDQLFDVLPAFGVARKGHVRVGQLVDQQQPGPPGQGPVEVEFVQLAPTIFDLAKGQDFEALEQRRGLRTAVGFNHSHHHVEALRAQCAGGLEHGVGFADTGGGAEKNLQLAAP